MTIYSPCVPLYDIAKYKKSQLMVRQMTIHITPQLMSKQAFLSSYPTLHYGLDKGYLVVETPDHQVCALALHSFPESRRILSKYHKHILIEKKISLKEDLTCLLVGTPLQHQVWQALLQIPKGTTLSYQQLANKVGSPKAVRAVANAVGSNPISPLIPCHRVLRSNGHIGGYYWGLPAKLALLKEEGIDVSSFKRLLQS
jgi:O-6-methylguanine DNA methyltransferase